MKTRIGILIQGILIGIFGIFCMVNLAMKGIGMFFVIFGLGIALTAVFGRDSDSVDK